jgi:flavin reductase (DIM6/NTAB) family NADH-FMN oxidoreductase RutF
VTLDPLAYRQVAGAFATGVSVVTTGRDGNFHAITINSLTSVSLEPTLLLICLDRNSRTLPLAEESGVFNINILREDQEHISRTFATRNASHALDEVEFELGALGAPLITGCLAYLQCRVVDQMEAGDHTILLAQVEQAHLGEEGPPLLYYRGRYGVEGPRQPAGVGVERRPHRAPRALSATERAA